MSFVVVCGQPCSGKSTVVAKLARSLRDAGAEVIVVDEPGLHLGRNDAYKDTVSEKNTRGMLKSAAERAITRRNVVILDSINNIKGYRYELWCVARAAGCRYCMVHVDSDVGTCRAWNAARSDGAYSEQVFDDLAGRFERPDARNRWDAPLFTVQPQAQAQPAAGEGCSPTEPEGAPVRPGVDSRQSQGAPPSAAEAAPCSYPAGPSDDACATSVDDLGADGAPACSEADVLAAVVHAVLGKGIRGSSGSGNGTSIAAGHGHVRPSGTSKSAAQLEPTFSTANNPLSGTNTLAEIDRSAQDVVDLVAAAQASAGPACAAGTVHLGDGLRALHFEQPVTVAELRRHKRAFIKLTTKVLFAKVSDPAAAKRMFVDYLRDNVAGAGWPPL